MKYLSLDFERCEDGCGADIWTVKTVVNGVTAFYVVPYNLRIHPMPELVLSQLVHEIGLALEMFGVMAKHANENNQTVHCGDYMYRYLEHCVKLETGQS